ncbi:MAG: hypothetical protein OEX03_00360 [Gammaproteobacteria bacterium]|nr:hypothetical protein [Gammaproteobacteria bacterium]
MLTLPSGMVVDLSADRARFHALQKQGAWDSGRCSDLYPLVDVVIRYRDENGVVRRGWTEYDYEYSGYTIADLHHAQDWTEEDKSQFFVWLHEAIPKQTIKSASRRLVDGQNEYSVKSISAPRHLYSLLRKRIQKLKLSQASAAQWLATLLNMQRQGIRAEELEWSGCIPHLKNLAPETSLKKEKILRLMDNSKISIQVTTDLIQTADGILNFREVAIRMPHQVVRRAALKLDAYCLCILRFHDEQSHYRIGVIKTLNAAHPMALNRYWFAMDPYGRVIPSATEKLYFKNSYDAICAANQHARESGILGSNRFHEKYGHLTLFGGNDYREWKVSLPDYQRSFFGAHYLDHNILAHIRTTTREDIHGNKLLFIEELQSDWHQQGKLHGYDNNPWGSIANAPFKKEWAILAIKLMLIRASQNGYDAIAWPQGKIQEYRYGKSLTAIRRRYDKDIPRALNRLVKRFNTTVTTTLIETCEPSLNLVKEADKWRIEDSQGKFRTRAKYHNRQQALEVLYCHSRKLKLEVQALFINTEIRTEIAENGMPVFGTVLPQD